MVEFEIGVITTEFAFCFSWLLYEKWSNYVGNNVFSKERKLDFV